MRTCNLRPFTFSRDSWRHLRRLPTYSLQVLLRMSCPLEVAALTHRVVSNTSGLMFSWQNLFKANTCWITSILVEGLDMDIALGFVKRYGGFLLEPGFKSQLGIPTAYGLRLQLLQHCCGESLPAS